jgi:hypothetical protein
MGKEEEGKGWGGKTGYGDMEIRENRNMGRDMT